MKMSHRVLFLLALILAPLAARAHETDQFTVPPDRKFADLGDYFNRWAYRAIEQGVNVTNDQIRRAIDSHAAPEVLSELQSPPHVTMAVRTQWPWSVSQIEAFEQVLASQQMRDRYPGRVVAYGERFAGVYQWAFLPFDIRRFGHIFFFSSTINVYGTYLGTDKLGHFTDEGISYYFEYHKARDAGASERESIARAVRLGSDGLMSESGLLGLASNGDYSNGDIAANFAGFMFYRNLTETVRLKGELRGPMLERTGSYWRIADDVRPDSGFFARFISDHLDEALNPGFFDGYLRQAMHEAVRARRSIILQHYCDEEGQPRPRAWFDARLRELNTYWGIDYGHRGAYDELVSIGNSCFGRDDPPERLRSPDGEPLLAGENWRTSPDGWLGARAAEAGAGEHRPDGPDPFATRFGQSPLHVAAQRTTPAALLKMSLRASAVNARDDFGRTPLHEAARTGTEQAVRRLLDAGADPAAEDDYGNTPLHLACRRGNIDIARALLDRGADANARSAAGTTPLHEAASTGDAVMVRLLLARGADPNLRDEKLRSPAQVAAVHGFPELATVLRTSPANPGPTPGVARAVEVRGPVASGGDR